MKHKQWKRHFCWVEAENESHTDDNWNTWRWKTKQNINSNDLTRIKTFFSRLFNKSRRFQRLDIEDYILYIAMSLEFRVCSITASTRWTIQCRKKIKLSCLSTSSSLSHYKITRTFKIIRLRWKQVNEKDNISHKKLLLTLIV